MSRRPTSALRSWGIVSLGLGAAATATARHLAAGQGLGPHDRAALELVTWAGLTLCLAAGAVLVIGRRLEPLFADDGAVEGGARRRPYVTLFLASFVALFVEVMLIRYSASQIRIFSFYKNVPLVACFLGLGLGCWLGKGRSRHALSFLLWLLPLAFFFSYGSHIVGGYLGRIGATGSSEQILGGAAVPDAGLAQTIAAQLIMGGFCVMTLLAITALFTLIGRLLGEAFEQVPRLPGYTVNILASLLGVLAFVLLSSLWTPPWVWFAVGLAPLLWWLPDSKRRVAGLALLVLSSLAVAPAQGNVVWSSYQKLVGFAVPSGEQDAGKPSYMVQISDVFYQIAVDLRPGAPARRSGNPYPHYDGAFAGLPSLERVLVVGAGTGNDVAAALRAGASRVDAVDIDAAILRMGRRHHPEDPYGDPRVHVIVGDARAAFRSLPHGAYDAVVFGLLDSHTQLGISSVRLDNYVFTMESLASARRLLKPGGHLILTAATFREWFRDRFVAMLEITCGAPVTVTPYRAWLTYRCQPMSTDSPPVSEAAKRGGDIVLPTDDWPFLYLPTRGVPTAYLVVVGMLVLASVLALRVGGLELRRFSPFHLHLFFMGAAFLLMEVVAINRLALLFGTTWIVSAITIALVLVLIVAANLTVTVLGALPYWVAYAALIASLLVGYEVEPTIALGRGPGAALLYGLVILLPIYFAGLIFARSFRSAELAGPAIGANILGSVFGGWTEYATMAVGIRAMALVALAIYLLSLLALVAARRQRSTRATP